VRAIGEGKYILTERDNYAAEIVFALRFDAAAERRIASDKAYGRDRLCKKRGRGADRHCANESDNEPQSLMKHK
jgi:hypothetical protein